VALDRQEATTARTAGTEYLHMKLLVGGIVMPGSRNRKEKNSRAQVELLMVALLLGGLLACGNAYAKFSAQEVFPSPEHASAH